MSRYAITELEGVPGFGTRSAGLSVHVLDVPYNRRLLASFRSEDYGAGWRGREVARRRAEQYVAKLEGRYFPTYPRKWVFRPTCPECRARNEPRAEACAWCGARLV